MRVEDTKPFVYIRYNLIFLRPMIFLSSCNRNSQEQPVAPPVTHPLARSYIGYGVVNVSFTHLLSESSPDGVSQGYIRRGTVVRIIERRHRLPAESWILAEANYQNSGSRTTGWLKETNVDIYDSESRALNASKNLSQ
jgi:hypothetical protein